MKAGEQNLLCRIADIQIATNINFNKKWYQRFNRRIETTTYQVGLIALGLLISEKVFTYVLHCLEYYTR